MFQEKLDNLNNPKKAGTESCSVCEELLIHLQQFFNMLETARRTPASNWLTVDDIAKELKVSKSIVYRLIRHGELEAVDIVETNGEIPQKGHYRIKRSKLNQYLEHKKVKPFPNTSTHRTPSRRLPKVKNHLGL
jgi:predicted DNA-binding protein YlxM (UPF0122 family)